MYSDDSGSRASRKEAGASFSLVSPILIVPLSVLAWIIFAVLATGFWSALAALGSLMRYIF